MSKNGKKILLFKYSDNCCFKYGKHANMASRIVEEHSTALHPPYFSLVSASPQGHMSFLAGVDHGSYSL
jgi:hypothetical protein